ncbi:hypothetical protein LX59_00002 [Azomonas agilis]|uniref:Uncharacterized protein n=1 Tax=Azomonas agilis TaxID=116849 RepID=A0A562IZH4_9GAMM|nr:hypothetical protein [Azomonas agilis]TWH63995.1 hypothetical protein LX59_02819 [Azomonas agilis]TWH76441.1 hypothetical protein LX59_00477 [Azomonas agilis]TWH77101.1 hypothetical protein LX59_00002 [Azomonas agilis]
MSRLRELLVDLDSIAPAFRNTPLTTEQTERLQRITQAADSCFGTLTTGVSAIGWCIASAAHNQDFGLNADELMSLGWLLQELGNLSLVMTDLSRGAEERLSLAQALEVTP